MNLNTLFLFLKASIRSADIITTLKPPVRSSTILTTTDQHVTYKTDASTIGKNIILYSFLQDKWSQFVDFHCFISRHLSVIS